MIHWAESSADESGWLEHQMEHGIECNGNPSHEVECIIGWSESSVSTFCHAEHECRSVGTNCQRGDDYVLYERGVLRQAQSSPSGNPERHYMSIRGVPLSLTGASFGAGMKFR